MTDLVLTAPDKETMYSGFKAVGIVTELGIRLQGRFSEDGTEWVLLDWGPRFSGDKYFVVLRWNGTAPLPPLQEGIAIEWKSDLEEPGEYPPNLPRFG